MKKTLFNASLEESMNLVTDKYIQTSMEDINEKGYWRKIIGSFTMILFILMFHVVAVVLEESHADTVVMKQSNLTPIWIVLSLGIVINYFRNIAKVKNDRILSYYYYNNSMAALVGVYLLQAIIMFIVLSVSVTDNFLPLILYSILFLAIIISRVISISKEIKRILYQSEKNNNRVARFLEQFVVFSRKYGWLVVLILYFLRNYFKYTPSETATAGEFDTLQIIGGWLCPLMMILPLYFMFALVEDNFQGYYLKKYLEDYRQLTDYSIEEWYGKKSKMYKESLKNK